MRKVNLPPPEAPGPAWYTVVTTTHDEVVLPFQSQALAGDHATNVILQRSARRTTPSTSGSSATRSRSWTVNALERPRAANPRFGPTAPATYGHDPDAG